MASPAKGTPTKATPRGTPTKAQPKIVEEAEEAEEPEVASGRGSGRGAAKAKAKAKGKFAKAKAKAKAKKGKGRGRAKPSAIADAEGADSGDAGSPKAKPKAKAKSSFKARVMADVGERDVDEVIAETRAQVAAKEKAISAVASEEQRYDADIQKARTALTAASARVEEATMKEAISFEKLKATREATVESGKAVREAQGNRGDAEKALAILELEAECRAKMKHLEDAKKQAEEAAAAAKKALEDVKTKEKAAQAAAKTALTEQKEKEQETLKVINDRQIQLRDASKDSKGAGKGLAKELAQEMKEVEKRRAEREKLRVQNMKEVMTGKGAKRVANGAETPTKAARVEDVD